MFDSLVLAYALVALALVFLGLEFVLPGGVMAALGVAALIAGLAMLFSQSAAQGLATVIALCILAPILGPLFVHFWPKTRFGKRLVLSGPEDDASMANMPGHLELEQLRGRYGKTLSSLRPSGVTEFDGKRIDALSEGPLIEPGQWVRCIDVHEGRVIVRRVEKPPDLADMDPVDLQG